MNDHRDTLKRAADELRHVICIMPEDDSHLKALAAALDRMAEQEPVAVRKWHDEFKCWNYDDIEDVLPTHSGERLYAAPVAPVGDATGADWEVAADNWKAVVAFCRQHPGESVTILAVPAVPADDARDAARYRWLRSKENQDHDAWNMFGPYSSPQEIDAVIDAAMKEPK